MNSTTTSNKKTKLISRICGVAIALVVWQITAMVVKQSILLVTPVEVVQRLLTIWQEEGFLSTILYSLGHIGGGFLLGLVLGILLASIAYKVPFFEGIFWPWFACVKSVPVASFVVICLIWMRLDALSIFISFLIVLPIVYQNTLTGLKKMDSNMAAMAMVFRISPIKKLRYIVLPQISSYIMSAVNVGLGMAWKAGVAAEVIGTPNGSIGRNIYLSKIYLDTDDLLAWTVIIVILSIITEKAFSYLLGLLFRKMKVV